jgi:hypothetical protein
VTADPGEATSQEWADAARRCREFVPSKDQTTLACAHLATWLDDYLPPCRVKALIAEVADEGVRDVLAGMMSLVGER